MAGNLADRQAQALASAKRQGKAFYPQALVGITAFMETMKPPDAAELHPRYGGALRALRNSISEAVRPTQVRVIRNSYNKPDSFHVEFDARALPVTPKQLRACAVDVYLWAASSTSARVPQDAAGNIMLEPVISGLVDDVTMRYEGGGNLIQLDGQDYTALFSQKLWSTKKSAQRRSPTGLRLDLQLEGLLREADAGGVLQLKVEPDSLRAELPVVGAAYRRVNKKGQPVPEKASWWDVMYRMAQQHGYILFVDGLRVVLTQPHVLHEHRAGLGLEQPERPIYRFAWGRNLASLEMQRHLGKEINPVIEIASYDERTRRTITARYPSRADKVVTGIGTQYDQVQRYLLHGVQSEAILRATARTVYELIAKGEQSVAVASDDATDLAGSDLLQMRSGDAATIDIDVFNDAELARLPEPAREARLRAAGFDPSVAQYVARNYDVVDTFKGPFRVREVTFDYSTDGLEISADLQNFVKVPTEAA